MKYRIQEHYKQTDGIPNIAALQTNRWNTEHRNTTNKQMKYRIQEHYKQTDEIQNTGAPQTNTNNVNKTWGLLQITGGKDGPKNIEHNITIWLRKTVAYEIPM
jgi:hypothetical protein